MTKIYRINHQGKRKEEVIEINENRYKQIMSAMSFITNTSKKSQIITKTETDKTVITLKEESKELLSIEIHDYRDSAKYFVKEAA